MTIQNDANELKRQMKQFAQKARELRNLGNNIENARIALGITYDGNTVGVEPDQVAGDAANAVIAYLAIGGFYETYKTNMLKVEGIGGS